MTEQLIDLIVGARPNFMKISPILDSLEEHASRGGKLKYRLIHTGQHYDKAMSGSFFEQLGIPDPDINLDVGSGTQAEQTAQIMIRYEKVLTEKKSDLCLVVGDVTSTMACAIVARKMGVEVAHVEGGIRSNDWAMPEEVNRVVTDSITNWFFTTSKTAGENLKKMGVEGERIFFVGNTMISTLLKHKGRLKKPDFWGALGLEKDGYIVLTMHRPSNVDEAKSANELLELIVNLAPGIKIVFPIHPRTAKNIQLSQYVLENIHVVEPLGYLEFNYLVNNAKVVVTDSGGITEEATVLNVPCITLRDSTERPETVELGSNVLVGSDKNKLKKYLTDALTGNWKEVSIPEQWDADVGDRIVSNLVTLLGSANYND